MSRQCHHLVGGVFSLVLIQIGGRVSDVFGALPANVIGIVFYVLFLYDGFLHPPISCTMVIFVMFMGTSCFRNVSATTEASKLPKPHERAAFVPDDHTPENREPCSRALTSRCKKLRSVNFIDRWYIFCKYFKYISNNTSCGQAFKKDKGGGKI